LLYGEGDMIKTCEIATRCGQDADCNPSNAAGVLGCMKGYAALGADLVGGIPAMAGEQFSHTEYSFDTLIPACQRVMEAILRGAGGKVTRRGYRIPVQRPRPPEGLEQWTDQMAILSVPVLPHELAAWNPAWRVTACGPDMDPGVRASQYGRENVLVIHPVDRETPAVIEADLPVPGTGAPTLVMDVASDHRGDFLLKVFVNGECAASTPVATEGTWTTVRVDLGAFAGHSVPVRIENHATDWSFEAAYLGAIRIE
ncbi:MAG: ADP-ribosylglycohydrolase family protein, partial [Candidatus Hydrogenedentes bacterium]|nr:ADP-ribosylglycohydrolase family protein [Candidatus Hydrogenedentota bacterium]